MNLPKLEAAIRELLPDLKVQPVTVLGRAGAAGSFTPHPSSAAKLKTREACWWVPWPMVGWLNKSKAVQAPIFLWNGDTKVFPTMRIQVGNRPRFKDSKDKVWRFYTLDDWLWSAVCEWRFPLILEENETRSDSKDRYCQLLLEHPDAAPGPLTVMRQLESKRAELTDAEILQALGNVIRFALHGRTRYRADNLLSIRKQTGLKIPLRTPWLRPIAEPQDEFSLPENRLHLRAVRSQLLSGHLYSPDRSCVATKRIEETTEALKKGHGIPQLYKSLGKEAKFTPDPETSGTIDPYHTPEGETIRVCLYAADGAQINVDRSLTGSKSNPHSLSPATSQIPFAEYDDPRRLLLGAKAQVHAVGLTHPEEPLVVTPHRKSAEHDPPGVNLRVGYLAWAGWNHEDAWVLSRSAADKLQQRTRWTQSVAISSVEREPEIRFPVGENFEKDEPLVYRQFSPALLWPVLSNCSELYERDSVMLGNGYGLEAEEGDRARQAGQVIRIEVCDLARGICRVEGPDGKVVESSIPYDISEEVYRRYRAVYRFHLQQERSLEVGDKLANRHGHKGVVGLILPDERMPQWKGKPLEALIDPISVLNRGNWGQLYETLVGAVATERGGGVQLADERSGCRWLHEFRHLHPNSNERGACPVTAPANAPWFSEAPDRTFRALVGSQFVLRMPQHASDKLSADVESEFNRREVKFDAFSRFALWAHSELGDTEQLNSADKLAAVCTLSRAAIKLRQQLWLAGVRLELPTEARQVSSKKPASLAVRRLDLGTLDDIPKKAIRVKLEKVTRADSMQVQLEKLESDRLYVYKLPTPLSNKSPSLRLPWKRIRWIPLVSYGDAQPKKVGRQVTLATRLVDLGKACVADRGTESLLKALSSLVYEALRTSVGTNDVNSKKSRIQGRIQGFRRKHSGRAVIAPSGLPAESREDLLEATFAPDPLSINEIGLPDALFQAVASSSTAPPLVWFKRDPVLHRWGLLPVRAHKHGESVIRLPASLLGALGADFDGDDAAVMAVSPHEQDTAARSQPAQISLHDFFKTPMFKPGKQYVYGLHLLSTDPRNAKLFQKFQTELHNLGAPRWPKKSQPAGKVLDAWCVTAGAAQMVQAQWWTIIEKYALLALAADPGMGLGIFSELAELGALEVIQSKAAKSEYCEDEQPKQRVMIEGILQGKSLSLFQNGFDPVGDIMAKAIRPKGQFGNEVRHLIWKAKTVNREMVRAAQTLTEKLTQSVLSVKSIGKPLPDFLEYKKYLRPTCLSTGNPLKLSEKESRTKPAWVHELPEMGRALEELERHGWPPGQIAPWCKWLFAPYKLLELLHPVEFERIPGKTLKLPVDDMRVKLFLSPVKEKTVKAELWEKP